MKHITLKHDTYGYYSYISKGNTIYNITASSNDYGFYIYNSSDNTINSSRIDNNIQYGLYSNELENIAPNKIYNNIFNNTNNVYFSGVIYTNYWNTTLTSGINIYGGPYIGGNFWAKPDGTGFSETCYDSDINGICDSSYTLATDNIDYLPLAFISIPMNPLLKITISSKDNYFKDKYFVSKYNSYSTIALTTRNLNYNNYEASSDNISISEKISNQFLLILTKASNKQIEDRSDLIKKGKFFKYSNPSFGYSLSNIHEYIIEISRNFDLLNSLTVSPGYNRISIRRKTSRIPVDINVKKIN